MTLPHFWHSHLLNELPFLWEYRQYCQQKKPLKGLNILNNTPLTLETLIKVDCLIAGGAKVTVTNTKFIKPSTSYKTHEFLPNMKITYISNHNDLAYSKDEYDFVLDCGAELLDIVYPKKGFVELTGSGSAFFKAASHKLAVPVISVDDSALKNLETFYGTADAFIRALKQFSSRDLKNISVVLFGYGKVGRGVIYGLSNYTSNITIIDQSEKILQKARTNKLKARTNKLEAISINKIDQIKQTIAKSELIITATGHQGLLSTLFKRKDLRGKLLANVSAVDDFGENIPEEDVLGRKQPLNFLLEMPTLMRYLDPSLYAHNLCIELMLNNNFKSGYHPLPKSIDEKIINKWQDLHKEDISLAIENLSIC